MPSESGGPGRRLDGRFVYTANAGSGSISGFSVRHDGALHLTSADGLTGSTGTGSRPTNMVQSRDGRFLYSLNNGNGTISAFQVKADGTLASLTLTSGLPANPASLGVVVACRGPSAARVASAPLVGGWPNPGRADGCATVDVKHGPVAAQYASLLPSSTGDKSVRADQFKAVAGPTIPVRRGRLPAR